MERSKDLVPAQLAIDKIAEITNEADLSAFIEGEERVTVTTAADARYAELVSTDKTVDEDSTTDKVDAPASEDETDVVKEDEAAEEVEVIIIGSEEMASIGVIVVAKVEQEKARFTNRQLPAGNVTLALQEAFTAIKEDAAAEVENEISIPLVGEFLSALNNQITIDQSNRGLSQPGKIDSDLITLFKGLTED